MARLTIPDEQTYATFTATAQTVFPISFALLSGKADLRISVNGVERDQSGFTFAGALLEGGGYQGGTVTLNTAATGVVRIWRDIDPERTSQFSPANVVPVRSVDMALNRAMALAQDARRDVGRALLVDFGAEVPDPDGVLDAAAVAALKANKSGDGFTDMQVATFLEGAGAKTLFNQTSVLSFIPTTLWPAIAAGTITSDLTAYVQAALDSGRDVTVPPGLYPIDTVYMSTPRQQLLCSDWSAKFKQINASGQAARPMLILMPAASSAFVGGGEWDHNAAACGVPTQAGGIISHGTAVVSMADDSLCYRMSIKNAWDNGLGFSQYNVATGVIVSGHPVSPKAAYIRTENCGCGIRDFPGIGLHQAGSGINNLTAQSALVLGCVDYYSRTGFIADYGAGASGSFISCTSYYPKISTGASGVGGHGVYNGTGGVRWVDCRVLEPEGDGVWLDGYSQNVEGDFYIKGGRQRGALIQGKNIRVHVTAELCSYNNPGVYDAILVQGTADIGGGSFGNSTGIELVSPTTSGTFHRYGLSVVALSGRTVAGISIGGLLNGATAALNNTQSGFVVDSLARLDRTGYAFTYGRRVVSRACASYLSGGQVFGDSAGNGALFVESGVTPDKRMAAGYDDTNDVFVMQAIHAGVAQKPMLLNPSGGSVMAGTGAWDSGPMRLGAYRLWIDSSGRLRVKNGAPTSDTDGTVVGTQT